MCGIAGFLSFAPSSSTDEVESAVNRMASAIRHRGPDDEGVWVDAAGGIALGHRRLSILDLSTAGHQPMHSRSGRFVIVFNGEIYNFEEIRAGLGTTPFRGHSDTEVLLAAFEKWGIPETLARANGMFAIAVWDRQERALVLARDRFGEKPLYFGCINGGRTLVFGSELKALRAHPSFDAPIYRNALVQYMRYGYFPAPHSVYEGIFKLAPGMWLRIRERRDVTLPPTPYWTLRGVAEYGIAQPLDVSPVEAVDLLEVELRDAIKRQMVADVPIGAFLSGGVDSSTVVALMQAQSPRPIRTFTIGFNEAKLNEAEYAKAVARHLGTEHTEAYVTPNEARQVIPILPTIYDEPFADSSQIPTFLVAQLARKHVVVSLSGDAGDELFAGYQRYALTQQIWAVLGRMPRLARTATARLIASFEAPTWDTVLSPLVRALPTRFRVRPGDRIRKLGAILANNGADALYAALMSTWATPEAIVLGGQEPRGLLPLSEAAFASTDVTERAMFADASLYLPDDILTKVDRAAMSVGLETRVPLLDRQVVDLAWRLPRRVKVREHGGKTQGKWILREVLARYVPRKLFERPKMGFAVPVGEWLRGPLRPWAEELLSEARLRREGFLDPKPIRQRWHEHVRRERDWQSSLWFVLMWQAWLEALPPTKQSPL